MEVIRWYEVLNPVSISSVPTCGVLYCCISSVFDWQWPLLSTVAANARDAHKDPGTDAHAEGGLLTKATTRTPFPCVNIGPFFPLLGWAPLVPLYSSPQTLSAPAHPTPTATTPHLVNNPHYQRLIHDQAWGIHRREVAWREFAFSSNNMEVLCLHTCCGNSNSNNGHSFRVPLLEHNTGPDSTDLTTCLSLKGYGRVLPALFPLIVYLWSSQDSNELEGKKLTLQCSLMFLLSEL